MSESLSTLIPPREVRLPLALRQTARRLGIRATRTILLVDLARQRMHVVEPLRGFDRPQCLVRHTLRISSSRFGIGELKNSNCTPRGLHRVATKVGAGWPTGSVFRSRKLMGFTWDGLHDASITHRILWLEGLEPGKNRGGNVDTFERFIYIHGTGDEPGIGRPASHGCIHLAAKDLMPLHDWLPTGSLVWIS